VLQEKQRAIQIRLNSQSVGNLHEVLVEGYNHATGQWIGRTSPNRIVNFVTRNAESGGLQGSYRQVRVTRAGPNSLAGEMVA